MSEESIWYYVSKGDYTIHPVLIEWSDGKYIKRPERKKATVKDCSWHYYAPTLKDAVWYVVDKHLRLLRFHISEALDLEHALEELKTLYPDETQAALNELGPGTEGPPF